MDFLGMGPVEILVAALVAFIFLGPTKMMEVTRSLGKLMQDLRRTTREFPKLLSLDEPVDKPARGTTKERTAQDQGSATDSQSKGTDEQ